MVLLFCSQSKYGVTTLTSVSNDTKLITADSAGWWIVWFVVLLVVASVMVDFVFCRGSLIPFFDFRCVWRILQHVRACIPYLSHLSPIHPARLWDTSWTWGGGWEEQNGSGQLRYPGGTKCFSLPLKMNKFSFHCFGSKEPTAAILSPKSFKAC